MTTRSTMIEENIPLAWNLARRYACEYYELDDARQDACVALCRAVDAYDETLGYTISTFATSVIWRDLA